jgi:hypothetical protein
MSILQLNDIWHTLSNNLKRFGSKEDSGRKEPKDCSNLVEYVEQEIAPFLEQKVQIHTTCKILIDMWLSEFSNNTN